MANRKLGKSSDQRVALLRNQTTALLWNGKIVTTETRAKEVRSLKAFARSGRGTGSATLEKQCRHMLNPMVTAWFGISSGTVSAGRCTNLRMCPISGIQGWGGASASKQECALQSNQ